MTRPPTPHERTPHERTPHERLTPEHPTPQHMTVGVVGGGQLGRMLALAGAPLGLRLRFLDPARDAPAGRLGEHIVEDFNDPQGLRHFARGLDVVTYEFENVPVESARYLAQRAPVYPPVGALQIAQDRLSEKNFFQQLHIPTPTFAPVESRAELDDALARIGLPAVLKTRRFGYDGKGQQVLREPRDAKAAWKSMGGVPLIVEAFVPFARELSLIAVRARDGATAFYPLVENHHRDGILRMSLAPAPGNIEALQTLAEAHARKLMEALDYVGVLTIEFFEQSGDEGADGEGSVLLANEMAPRVHNSGHWTIEGARESQFENHLRAVCGWPLGQTEVAGHCAMLNLIGSVPCIETLLATPGVHLHLYDKEAQPGRKLGHVTLCAHDEGELHAQLKPLRALPGLG